MPHALGGEEKLNETFDFGLAEDSVANASAATIVGETTMLRRSRRVQELNESRVLRERSKTQEASVVEEKKQKRSKKPQFLKNKYLASYFRLSTHLEGEEEKEKSSSVDTGNERKSSKTVGPKHGKNQHATEVLKILNQGNLKELQILPQVGLKTAYQIMSCRATQGRFRTFKDLKRLNWTEKKVETFMKANFVA